MLETFTVQTFAQHLGDKFQIVLDSSPPMGVELIAATELGGAPRSESTGQERRIPFSIVFRGRRDVVLPQRIYSMEHAKIGAFELFLVPIGPDNVGMQYEAIFT